MHAGICAGGAGRPVFLPRLRKKTNAGHSVDAFLGRAETSRLGRDPLASPHHDQRFEV